MAIKDKATTIATALDKLANVKTATVVGNTVEVVGQKDSTAGLKDPQRFVGVVVAKDTTQEPKAMVTDGVKGIDPPEVAVVGYSGSLSGEDGTGAEAVYQATLGDSDFTASSNLTYGTVLEDSIKSGMSLLVDRIQRLMPAFDGGDDFVWIGDPLDGFRIGVVVFEKPVDGGLEIDDRTEDATLEATLRQGGEEPLDRIEPKKLRSA
jgi:hypothetical protein